MVTVVCVRVVTVMSEREFTVVCVKEVFVTGCDVEGLPKCPKFGCSGDTF